jgi:hypothetical protein
MDCYRCGLLVCGGGRWICTVSLCIRKSCESRCGNVDLDVFFEDFSVVDEVFVLVSSTFLMMGICLMFFSLLVCLCFWGDCVFSFSSELSDPSSLTRSYINTQTHTKHIPGNLHAVMGSIKSLEFETLESSNFESQPSLFTSHATNARERRNSNIRITNNHSNFCQ